MRTTEAIPRRAIDPDVALRTLVEGTASETGEGFYRALVESLGKVLGVMGAWVTEYKADCRRLRALAFWLEGEWRDGYEHGIDGTPCAEVVEERRLVLVQENLLNLYPGDPDLAAILPVSYMGVPLLGRGGEVLGHLAVLDRRPMPPDERLLSVFRIFAARAAAEHQRLAAEARLRERETKLARLIDSAMDAILDLDVDCQVTVANAAAERLFRCPRAALVGRPVGELMTPAGHRKLLEASDALKAQAAGYGAQWIPGTLEARRCDGAAFAAEATISRYEVHGSVCHTVILRDIEERLAAERRIASLRAEAEYLRDELRELHPSDELLGTSPAMVRVLRAIRQVAGTDATVLVSGETGTGKELIARAIHAASRRADRPLVRVNCAAIPAALMESEFFGHERGAFTGATQRRIGRFALADGGTLFLDEVGELPVDMQVKLLRALQEGEFEPVGNSRTVKVDVRVIAATNRDLPQAIREGRFREDLYYRLNVFPIGVPPLRERAEDVVLLARAFVRRAAQRVGKPGVELSEECERRLRAYNWPGNVRELENVIERVVITARGSLANVTGCLPEVDGPAPAEAPVAPTADWMQAIYTVAEMDRMERENLLRALEASHWRVAGAGGAAERLGVAASTLRSRLKALGIGRRG